MKHTLHWTNLVLRKNMWYITWIFVKELVFFSCSNYKYLVFNASTNSMPNRFFKMDNKDSNMILILKKFYLSFIGLTINLNNSKKRQNTIFNIIYKINYKNKMLKNNKNYNNKMKIKLFTQKMKRSYSQANLSYVKVN